MSKARLSANDILAANLHALMKKQGVVQTVLAQRSGVAQTTISLYLSPERRQPSKTGKLPSAKLTEIEALATALGVTVGQILTPDLGAGAAHSGRPSPSTRSGLTDLDSAADEFPMRIAGMPDAPWEPGGVTTKQMEREGLVQFGLDRSIAANVTAGEPVAANEKFEKVLELADVRLAAGDGIEAENELVTGAIQFRQSFLRSVGADKGRGRVVYAKGDSMEGDIKDGWALLVVPDDSLTIRDLVPKTIYAINYDGKMIVKILDKDPLTGKWVAKSANRRYRDIPLETEGVSVRILGRVVWAGGRLHEGVAVR